MSGSFLTGPPREVNQGGKEGDFLALISPVIARSEVTKQSRSYVSNKDCHASEHPPSPQPSPLKGEGDYGRGLLEARLAMTRREAAVASGQ